MKATIITIGDEILIGQITDTNSAWISARLNETGVTVDRKLSIGDDLETIVSELGHAMQYFDIVIVTGGLGPTKDDITKTALCRLFDCGMHEDPATFEHIRKMTESRRFVFNELNRLQAMVPDACQVLFNANGTAPGMWFERGDSVLVSLPGVPFEMEGLMESAVLPRIRDKFLLSDVVHKTMLTFGIAESMLAETIADWENSLPPSLRLAYLPSATGIRLRLSAYETDRMETLQLIDGYFSRLENIIPEYFVGYGDISLESVVAELLCSTGKTLSVAESCTGGRISSRFTAMAGASEYFLAGAVTYSNESKTEILKVHRSDIDKYGAVSESVAKQMAEGIRRETGSDYSIATTGIAGPAGGSAKKPVGTVWIALGHHGGTISRQFRLGNLRAQNIERASSTAINMLRLLLREHH